MSITVLAPFLFSFDGTDSNVYLYRPKVISLMKDGKMEKMENWLNDLLQLPEACQVEEVLPQYFLSQNFKLTTGEKNLEKYSIDEMAIVGAIGPDYGGVAGLEGMASVAILVVETKGGKLAKEAGKIAAMLQKYLPQYVLIGLTDGEQACLSIASKYSTEDGLAVDELFMSSLFSSDKMGELAELFSFEKMNKENLKTLWADYCSLISKT